MNEEMTWIAYAGLAGVGLLYGAALIAAWRRRDQFWQVAATIPVGLWIAFGAPMLLSIY